MTHATDEAQFISFEVLAEGERLGVSMPYLKGFQECVGEGVVKSPAI
jgi:hypothetical protein